MTRDSFDEQRSRLKNDMLDLGADVAHMVITGVEALRARDRVVARALIDHYAGRVKPILVAGSYLDLMKRWQIPVYYDQQALLTRKFGIERVPALVSQEGMRLRIDELAL